MEILSDCCHQSDNAAVMILWYQHLQKVLISTDNTRLRNIGWHTPHYKQITESEYKNNIMFLSTVTIRIRIHSQWCVKGVGLERVGICVHVGHTAAQICQA